MASTARMPTIAPIIPVLPEVRDAGVPRWSLDVVR
jgi:hypothetical protein